jgi:sarcosine oxidase
VDRLPGEDRVVVLSPCSGHGFKFAPAIGDAAAALVRGQEPPAPLGSFAISRFTQMP